MLAQPRIRRRRRPSAAAPALLVLALLAPLGAAVPALGAAPRAAAARRSCPAASQLLASAPVARRRPARGVVVRSWDGRDGTGVRGHDVRLTVAEADLRVVRLAAAAGRSYGSAADTTELTAAATGAVVGVNGDYFAYDWSGAAVPYGPLVRGGRILRLPPGAAPAVGSDSAGRPVAGGVRVVGTVLGRQGRQRWVLPVLSVNDDGDGGGGDRAEPVDPVARGRGVAVVTPYLGPARPRRAVEVVVRRGVVVATGRRVPFGPRAPFGSGRAGQGDTLLAASGAAAATLRTLRVGTVVALRFTARFADGSRVRDAVGSGAVLLRAGRDLTSCAGSAVQSRPRTMIAWDARRTRLWLIVVTGRGTGAAGSRYGLTYRQVTAVARGLGASDAVMVDGGGSSTMALRAGRLVHRVDAPADRPQRPVPDALVLLRR